MIPVFLFASKAILQGRFRVAAAYIVIIDMYFITADVYFITADWLTQLVEHRTAVREIAGSNLDRTNTEGLKIPEEKVLPL